MESEALNLVTLSKLFTDEAAARTFLERKRWPNGPVCSHCGHEKAYPLKPRPNSKRPVRPGVYKCAQCKKMFTVTTGTPFEGSRIGLTKWLAALHLVATSKKGVSAAQLQRQLGLTYKTAWFVCHRIREAMDQDTLLGGGGQTVEADETYLGGRKPRGVVGRGAIGKAPVQAVVERKGRVAALHTDGLSASELRANVRRLVKADSAIHTDQALAYVGIGRAFGGGHHTVNHSERFVDPETGAHTNTAECFFSLVKRSHYGTHHVWSKKHLQRYLNERTFHWNHRRETDGERMVAAIRRLGGKRIMYKELVA